MNYELILTELVLFVVAVIIAILSWTTAIKSLREAKKTRHDTFLPIVIVTAIHQCSSTRGEILFRNWGHGMAFDVKVHIPGSGTTDLSLQFLDPAEPQSRTISFKLPDSEIVHNPVLTLFYKDVFGRQIKTSYRISASETEKGLHNLSLKNEAPKIELP